MTVEHAAQVFAMDRLPGHGQACKQTGVLCLRFQAPVSLRGDSEGLAAGETSLPGSGCQAVRSSRHVLFTASEPLGVAPFSSTTRHG